MRKRDKFDAAIKAIKETNVPEYKFKKKFKLGEIKDKRSEFYIATKPRLVGLYIISSGIAPIYIGVALNDDIGSRLRKRFRWFKTAHRNKKLKEHGKYKKLNEAEIRELEVRIYCYGDRGDFRCYPALKYIESSLIIEYKPIYNTREY